MENGKSNEKKNNNDDLNALSFYPFENAMLVVKQAQAYCTLGYSVIRHPKKKEKIRNQNPTDHILIRASFARYCDDSYTEAVSLTFA